jgi:hypothetical protein
MERAISTARLNDILAATGMDDPDARLAEVELFTHLKPAGSRLVVTKPTIAAYNSTRVTTGGIDVPDLAIRALKEFGLLAWILSVGPHCSPEIVPGMAAIIPEYGGKPIYLNRATPYWIIGEGDILALVVNENS